MIIQDESVSAKYYEPNEVGAMFGVTGTTIRNMIHRGEIKAVRVGRMLRISEEEVEKIPKAFKKSK